MPVEKDALKVGLTLTGTYKKEDYSLSVVKPKKGDADFEFKLSTREEPFTSLSSAAMYVMDGKSANGWRFWGIPGVEVAKAPKGEKPAKEKAADAAKAKKKTSPRAKSIPPTISKARSQKDAPEGMTRYFCSACMKSFFSATRPTVCPEGHAAQDTTDDFTDVPAAADNGEAVADLFADA